MKLEKEKKTKKDKAELAKLTHIYKGMKKGIYNSYEPEGESIGERTLSSYIPSDRQGEARRANLDYTKAQLKKKEDQSTKNRGDLSKRDAGKMAKERLHNKKIMSMGEAQEVVDEGKKKGLWDNIHAKRKRGEKPAKPGDKDYPKTLNVEKVELDEAERKLGDRLHRKRKLYDRTVKKAMDFARREGEAAGHARYRMGQLDREMDKVKDKMKK